MLTSLEAFGKSSLSVIVASEVTDHLAVTTVRGLELV